MTARLRTGTYNGAEDSIDSLVGGSPLIPLALMAEDKNRLSTDRVWAHAFLLNAGLTLVAAVCFGRMAIGAVTSGTLTQAGRRQLLLAEGEDSPKQSFGGVGQYVFAGLLGVGVAIVSMRVFGHMLTCGRGIVYLPFGLFGSCIGLVVIMLLSYGAKISAAFAGIVCAGVMLLIYKKRHRIELSAAHLKISGTAVNSMPWLFGSTIVMAIVQLMWIFIAAVAALGAFVALETVTSPDGMSYVAVNCFSPDMLDNIFFVPSLLPAGATPPDSSCICSGQKISDEECEFSGLGIPFAALGVISLIWGNAVLHNIITCTVSGAVASWWFRPDRNSAPVKRAFYRATHSSFGTLCKAAQVQSAWALVRLLTLVIHFLPGGCTLFACVGDYAISYVMKYAVCCVGIYGLNVKEAGRRVRQLFEGRAVTAVANDSVAILGLYVVICFFALAFGVVFGIVLPIEQYPASISTSASVDLYITTLAFGAFIFTLAMGSFFEVVWSGFDTVFVCFVHHPGALAWNHDQHLYEGLNAAWNEINARSSQMVVHQPAHPYMPASVV